MDNELLQKLKEIVEREYSSANCGLTEENSSGNDMDVFDDGYGCGRSWLAYEIGSVLGIELEEPEE